MNLRTRLLAIGAMAALTACFAATNAAAATAHANNSVSMQNADLAPPAANLNINAQVQATFPPDTFFNGANAAAVNTLNNTKTAKNIDANKTLRATTAGASTLTAATSANSRSAPQPTNLTAVNVANNIQIAGAYANNRGLDVIKNVNAAGANANAAAAAGFFANATS